MRAEVARMLRFGIVGVSNTLLTLVTFALLEAAGMAAPPASAVAFGVGALNGYLLNRSWTFHSDRRGAGTILRYVAVQGFGAAASAAGVALASADLSLHRLVAEAVVLPAVTILTYALSRTVVFGVSEPA